MKQIIFLLLFLPLTIFAKPTKVEALDANCERMADIAEGLAKLKDIGYSVTELNSFTTESTVQVFPIQSLKTVVYSSDKKAAELRIQLSTLCNSIGFDTYNKFLLQSEKVEKLQIQIEGLQKYITELENKIAEQKPVKKSTPIRK